MMLLDKDVLRLASVDWGRVRRLTDWPCQALRWGNVERGGAYDVVWQVRSWLASVDWARACCSTDWP